MDALLGRLLNGWKRNSTAITQECCEQYWTSPGGNTQQDTNYTATCFPSRKLSKLDKPDMQDNAGEAEAYKWCTPMDTHIWPDKSRSSSSNIHSAAMWGLGCSPEDLPEVVSDREKWRERVWDIRASGMTWWWWSFSGDISPKCYDEFILTLQLVMLHSHNTYITIHIYMRKKNQQ